MKTSCSRRDKLHVFSWLILRLETSATQSLEAGTPNSARNKSAQNKPFVNCDAVGHFPLTLLQKKTAAAKLSHLKTHSAQTCGCLACLYDRGCRAEIHDKLQCLQPVNIRFSCQSNLPIRHGALKMHLSWKPNFIIKCRAGGGDSILTSIIQSFHKGLYLMPLSGLKTSCIIWFPQLAIWCQSRSNAIWFSIRSLCLTLSKSLPPVPCLVTLPNYDVFTLLAQLNSASSCLSDSLSGVGRWCHQTEGGRVILVQRGQMPAVWSRTRLPLQVRLWLMLPAMC